MMSRKRWSERTPLQSRTFTRLSVVQVVLAAAAWTDLSMRHREFVRGRELWWALWTAVNFVRPLSCFR